MSLKIDIRGAGVQALIPSGLLITSEDGTVAVAVNQLYSEQQPTRRGALIVRDAGPNSAAAEAGIQAGDLIPATDGKPVFNRDPFSSSVPGNWRKDLRYRFPLSRSPGHRLEGFEDLHFAPGFDNLDAPEDHSSVFLCWLDRNNNFGGEAATNFRGIVTLYDRRGRVISLFSESPRHLMTKMRSEMESDTGGKACG